MVFRESTKKEFERLVRRESLHLSATELIVGCMQDLGISRPELSRRMGRNKTYVANILNRSNMTLKTLADLATAMGVEFEIRLKEGGDLHA